DPVAGCGELDAGLVFEPGFGGDQSLRRRLGVEVGQITFRYAGERGDVRQDLIQGADAPTCGLVDARLYGAGLERRDTVVFDATGNKAQRGQLFIPVSLARAQPHLPLVGNVDLVD